MKLINDWKDWWRWWSLRLTAMGAMVSGYLIANPDIAVTMWMSMPEDIRSYMPAQYMPLIGLIIVGVGQVARFLKQNQPNSIGAKLAETVPLLITEEEPANPVEGLHVYSKKQGQLIFYKGGKWYGYKQLG